MAILAATLDAPSASLLFDWLRHAEFELTLFAAFWFVVGAVDEIALDLSWLWFRLARKLRTHSLRESVEGRPLLGQMAVLVPTWQEAAVIGATVAHARKAWPQNEMRLYVGCYRNDPETLAVATAAAESDPRVRVIVHNHDGPTTKADCLNGLYRALREDEEGCGEPVRAVLLHDAEDMVHPAALPLIDVALTDADFVQIPVRPEPRRGARWVAGHYLDEFTESHAKVMVVRDAFKAALPAAGVGCAIARPVLERLARLRGEAGGDGPFEAECLTEDYELGLLIAHGGGSSRFLRLRDQDGQLVATRSYFPERLPEAVRQKTRWMHGIAFQGWDRLGWQGRFVDRWMALRDRRGPLVALVLAVAYFLLVLSPALALAEWTGLARPRLTSPVLDGLAAVCIASLIWRTLARFAFTAREYGWAEGARAVLRIPVANLIAIVSGRRAIVAYVRSLGGQAPTWDKTVHTAHPAHALANEGQA